MPIAKLRWGYPPPVFVTKQIAVPQVSPENESGAWAKNANRGFYFAPRSFRTSSANFSRNDSVMSSSRADPFTSAFDGGAFAHRRLAAWPSADPATASTRSR
jgi:hypothetical protein